MTGALVGRDEAVNVLDGCLEQAVAGRFSTVFIRAEVGGGKSRLLEEAAVRALESGFRVLRAQADVLERGVPYGSLHGTISGCDGGWPGLTLPAEARPGSTDSPMAMARWLERWSGSTPAVLVLDDLHAADHATVRLVAYLARQDGWARGAVVCTVAAHPPELGSDLQALIERLVTAGRATVVDVKPLDGSEVAHLLAELLEGTPDDSLVTHVADSTGGNPHLVREAVGWLRQNRALLGCDGLYSLADPGCRLRLEHPAPLISRLEKLGPAANAAARVLSALRRGGLHHLGLVAELSRLGCHQLEAAFDALARANIVGLVEEGAFGFVHPIVGDTIYDHLGPAERRHYHSTLAGRLRDDRQAGAPVALSDLAYHLSRSAQPGDQTAVAVLVEAADAIGPEAPEAAADGYRQAVGLLALDSPLRTSLLARQARALLRAFRFDDAAQVGQEALSRLGAGPERDRVAAVVVTALFSTARACEALVLCDRLLAEPGAVTSRLLAVRARILVYLARFAEAERDGLLALELAEDDARRAGALDSLVYAAFAQGHTKDLAQRIGRYSLLEPRLSPAGRMSALATKAAHLAMTGSVREAQACVASAEQLRGEAGGFVFQGFFHLAAVLTAWYTGRWDEALDRGRWASIDPGSGFLLEGIRCVEAAICVDRGQYARAAGVCRLLSDMPKFDSFGAWATAGLDLAQGKLGVARRRLVEAWDDDREAGRLYTAHLLLHRLVVVELAGGNQSEARAWAGELADLAATVGTARARQLALEAQAVAHGDISAAREALAVAEDAWLVFGAAHCRLLLAEAGDDPRTHLRKAFETFQSLGAEPWKRRAAAEMRARGIPVPRQRRGANEGFTDVEVALARLVHEGLTNRQIAEALHFSPKTVEAYLSRLFARTGCTNRVELAMAVSDGRLGARRT